MKNNLTTSERGIKFIKQEEGEILHVYKDSRGLPTVGVGHLILASEFYKLGQKITSAESTRLLRIDLQIAENAVNSAVKISLNQNQFDALVSFVVNIGANGFKRSTLLKKLNAGDYTSAANHFLDWSKAGNDLNILRGRRTRERKLFLTPYKNSISTEKELASSNPSSQSAENSVETPDAFTGSAINSELLGSGAAQNTDNLATAVSQTTTEETPTGKVETRVEQNSFQAEKKDLPAPAPDGSTASAAKVTIAGITVPAVVLTAFGAIGNWIQNGVIDLKSVFDMLIRFFTENTRYIFYLIIAFLVFLAVKKTLKQISFIVNMILNAHPGFHDINVVPGEKEVKK